MKWVRNSRLKKQLMDENPRCYHCSKKVFDYGLTYAHTKPPHDMATIDHLVSRYFRNKNEEVEKVLCCYRCNQKRAKEETKLYGSAHVKKLRTTGSLQSSQKENVEKHIAC